MQSRCTFIAQKSLCGMYMCVCVCIYIYIYIYIYAEFQHRCRVTVHVWVYCVGLESRHKGIGTDNLKTKDKHFVKCD